MSVQESENFFDDWATNKKKEKKFSHEPIKFSLTEYSNNGCNYCLHGNCTNHYGEKANHIHPLIKSVIKNPSKIIGDVPKILKDNGFDIDNKHIHVNTCIWNYTHSNCKNCNEGRFKYIKFVDSKGRNQELKFCVPVLKKNSNVIPIGFHWDVELLIEKNEIKDYQIHNYDGFSDDIKSINSKESINKPEINETSSPAPVPEIKFENIKFNKTGTVWDNKINFKEESKEIDQKEIDQKENNKYKDVLSKNIIKKSDSKSDLKSDSNAEIVKLKDEIKLLMKENLSQKEAIKGLKTTINLENSDSSSELKNKYNLLINKNKKLEETNKELKEHNLKMKDEINKIKNGKLSDKDTEYIKEQAIKSVKNYSNIIFESIMRSHYC